MWSNGLLKSIAICAQSSFAPTQCLDYLVDICIDRQSSQHTALTLDVYMSFIISVFIVGYSKADLSHFDTSAIATTTTTSSSSPSSAPLQAIHAREMKLARDESLVPSEYRPFYKVTVSCLHSHSQLSRRLIDTLVHSFKVLERPRFELYMQLIAPFLLNFLEVKKQKGSGEVLGLGDSFFLFFSFDAKTVKLPSDSVYSICYMMARLVELMNQEDSYGGLQQYYHHQQQLSYEALIQWPLHSVTRGVTEKIDAVHDLTNTDAADMLNILKFFYMHVPAVQETILSTFSEQLRGIISTTTASAATTSEQVVLLLKVLIEIIGDAAAKTKGSDITATSQLDSLVVIEEVCRGVEVGNKSESLWGWVCL